MSDIHVVYCPSIGYRVLPDTGKLFTSEVLAVHFVMRLRANGHHAWTETIYREVFDA